MNGLSRGLLDEYFIRSEHVRVRSLAFVSRSEVVNLLTICLVSLLYLSCRLNVIRCFALRILFKSSYFFSVAPSPSLRIYLPCVSWWLLVFPFPFADFLSSYWNVTSLSTQTLSSVYTCSFRKASSTFWNSQFLRTIASVDIFPIVPQ